MNWRKERGPLMLWREARAVISAVLALALVSQIALPAAVVRAAEGDDNAVGATPPRLSYADGDVSYFRPGATDWAPAEVNTAVAPGDELYTGNRGNLELQVGARAFVRAWGDSQLGLVNHEPDFLQIKVTSGHVSLDLRTVESGRTIELDTPHAAFTIERPGYYRVDVTDTGSSFVTRRSGQATMTPAGGQAVAVAASEEVVLEGTPTPTVRSYVAPELDVWDRWNYARTDDLIDAISSRYVSAGVYGIDDLDHYGDWRVVPTYGSVWVPQSVPAGWAPYSTGRRVLDPYYGWTWSTRRPGAGLRITTAAGCPSAATGRGRLGPWSSGRCTRRRWSRSSAGRASRWRSAFPASAGSPSAGASRSCRGGDGPASWAGRRGPAGEGLASSTTSSSIARRS